MRIGFIDHHLANYHADTFFRILTNGSFGEIQVGPAYEMNPQGTNDWCAERGVERACSAEEVIAKADALLVLAPDNFEVHRELALPAVASGKPVFVDKYLAPTLGEARELVDTADRHGTPLMSSSALYFAAEIEDLLAGDNPPRVECFLARGMGHWNGYGVHTAALAFRAVGQTRLERVRAMGRPQDVIVELEFTTAWGTLEVRQARNQFDVFPWQLGLRSGDDYRIATVRDYEGFYVRLMKATVDFFRGASSPIPHGLMLDIVAVIEGVQRSLERDGAWVLPEELVQ